MRVWYMDFPAAGCFWAFSPLSSMAAPTYILVQSNPSSHNKGYPRTFGLTKRVYLETIVIFPPSNLSQDSAPADALICWSLVGSKAEGTSVGAHPRRSAVVSLKHAGRRYHRHLKGTCTFNHIPINRQSFTAQPIPLPGLFVWRGCFILLISLLPFSAIAHQNLSLEGGHMCPIQSQI